MLCTFTIQQTGVAFKTCCLHHRMTKPFQIGTSLERVCPKGSNFSRLNVDNSKKEWE